MSWVKDGDLNIGFYHKSTIVRRNRSCIRMLKLGDEWVSDPSRLKSHINDFFSTVFDRRTSIANSDQDDPTRFCTIGTNQARDLVKRATV